MRFSTLLKNNQIKATRLTICLMAGLLFGALDNAAFAQQVTLPMDKIQAKVQCEGGYPGHLQGFCLDENEHLFWSFTTKMVKTDLTGKLIKEVPADSHHGDCCYADGKVYVAVNRGKFNDPEGNSDNWVYVYDADSLKEVARHEVQEVFHGAGGMAYHDGRFLIVGGLPTDVPVNYLYEYDEEFNFVKKHELESGWTLLGIQGADYAEGHWWFACYGDQLLKVNDELEMVGRYDFQCGYGILGLGNNQFYIARGSRNAEKMHEGHLLHAIPDEKTGMKIIE
ncbi:hypothetical protein Pla110_37040 [Polystyrenella longa]|uniref:Kelch motif protein n=1 Tax=Polystyrenella longa TaxID=2528007 RepID=A0A518CRV0_9PLAN|nr:hypothetical protein [Polystyrenella longa]QDU81952.1 hypothetical protein Pla110_37040 [Polystyrenella longa]